MNSSQRVRACTVIGLMVGGLLWSIVGRIDAWPLADFSMYNWIQGSEITTLEVYGVVQDEDPWELHLNSKKYLYPFDHAGLVAALDNFAEPGNHSKLRLILKGIWDRYEQRRERHAGPKLSGLRIYKMSWHLPDIGRSTYKGTPVQLIDELRP